MSWTNITDYVLEQLWSYQALNLLKNNARYVAETILGDPAANADAVPALTLDNGATDAGSLRFANGDTSFLKCDVSGTYLEVGGADFVIDQDNPWQTDYSQSLQGDQITLGATETGITTSKYLAGGGASVGYYCGRAGSIVTLSGVIYTVAYSGSGTVTLQIRKNGTSVFSKDFSIGAVSTKYTLRETQSRGNDAFAAEDVLSFYLLINGGTFTVDVHALMGVVLDT